MDERLLPAIIAQKHVTKHILNTFNIRANKGLGQNFLVNPEMVDTIVRSADLQPGDKVLEIGPGIGTLTQALALAGADVTAVELDAKLLPVLEKTLVGAGKVKPVPACQGGRYPARPLGPQPGRAFTHALVLLTGYF